MAQPYVGEIRIFAGNFAPAGWMVCNGALVPISEYDTLFNLIGTTYGGDGQSTFALPDLRGRVPVHQGAGPLGISRVVGEMFGAEQVTLTQQHLPQHSHAQYAADTAASPSFTALATPGRPAFTKLYGETPQVAMAPHAVGPAGGSQPHDNMAPFVALNFIIAIYGIYPSQS